MMSRVQRPKRVFGTDMETCVHSGGEMRIVVSVEELTPSAPSSPVSRITVRWTKRTTCLQCERRLRQRERRSSSQSRRRGEEINPIDAATIPQGCARSAP